LLVEDDREIASALALELTHEGYRVLTAHDGLAGLRAASETEPDLVVLDIMLPGVSGIEVSRRLRSRSTTPILMLTARASVRDRVDGLEAGADDYLIKPFSRRSFWPGWPPAFAGSGGRWREPGSSSLTSCWTPSATR
jgi:two-component system OmpR family response regulator